MIKEKLKLLPDSPGCYLMKNASNVVIYVGKAINLKRRVSSYFNRVHTGKTAVLVSNIVDFEYIVTNSEKEALLLEINLIKKYEPKYNIIFRDDKFYPYIEITNEKYPKLRIVRPKNMKNKKEGRLFGPYPNASAARTTINLLNRIYPLRKCDTLGKKVCLYYHLGECQGYCEKKEFNYPISELISNVTKFLNGDHTAITKKLYEEMNRASENLNYEKAMELKEQIDYINVTLNKQRIDLNDYVNRDVIGYYTDDNYISIQIFYIRSGMIVARDSHIYPLIGTVSEEISSFLLSFYEKKKVPKEILISDIENISMLEEILSTKIVVPQKGKKNDLVTMACDNAKITLEDKIQLIMNDEKRTVVAFENLGNLLGISSLRRVEIFDNSHLFGDYSVSGMVVFIDGKPSRKEYRKYKIECDAKDDYNQMKEVIYRRYFRVLKDKLDRPELIIVDGSIIQINAAKEIIDSLNLDIKICGLRKNNKHQTDGLMFDGKEIDVDKNSDLFFLLTRMQDEVHRFTINYHRDIRSKGQISSVLDNIKGIGVARKKSLLKKYGSVEKIRNAPIQELSKIVPEDVAIHLKELLNVKKKSD